MQEHDIDHKKYKFTVVKCSEKFKIKNGGKDLIAIEFIENLSEQFMRRLDDFTSRSVEMAKHADSNSWFEYGFQYTENTTKTFISSSIDDLCEGYFLQEYPTKRKSVGKDDRIVSAKPKIPVQRNGRIDFWCAYKPRKKRASFVVEVKQHWINYPFAKSLNKYGPLLNKHEEASDQVKSVVDLNMFSPGNMYGIALTIITLYNNGKKNREYSEINSDYVNKNINGVSFKNKSTHPKCYGYTLLNESISKKYNHRYETDKSGYQEYPGIICLWSIYKIHKDKIK